MTKSAEPSTPSGSSETQQRRRQITRYKNTTTSPATDTRVLNEGMAQLHKEWSYSAKAEYPVRLRPIGSITGISGILDHPPSRMMTVEGAACGWAMSCSEFKLQTVAFPERSFAISPRIAREFGWEIPYPLIRGRRECRAPDAPAASCALCSGRTHTSNNEYTGITRHSPRNGLRLISRSPW